MSIGARLNMRITRLAVGRHLPPGTVRVRLTLLYGARFLLSGAALVAITYVLFERATEYTKPHLPQIPHPPASGSCRCLSSHSLCRSWPRTSFSSQRTNIS
jgi:hypothetical protein